MYKSKVEDFLLVEEYNNNFAAALEDLFKVEQLKPAPNMIAAMYLRGLAKQYKVFALHKESEAQLGAPLISDLIADAIEEARNLDNSASARASTALVLKGVGLNEHIWKRRSVDTAEKDTTLLLSAGQSTLRRPLTSGSAIRVTMGSLAGPTAVAES